MQKKIAVLFLILLAMASGIYFYIYQGCRNIADEKSAFFVTATILQNDFNTNDVTANAKYLDKAISVKGKITKIDFDNNSIEIDDKILVVFKDSILKNLVLDQKISIKGRFIGYDDLFDQFRLDHATL